MLFSNPEISRFVRENFVAAWESVRPVPVVDIDFGNGRRIKRTVNGNIATYLCAPDGRVIDVIPGLYSPEAYLQELRYALNFYRSSFANLDTLVPAHHLANSVLPAMLPAINADIGKGMVEAPVKKAVGPAKRASADVGKKIVEFPVKMAVVTPAPSNEGAALAIDTDFNRRERKPLVHKILAEKIVRPAEITKRVYKDVLHCDLDDPFLGLVSSAFNGGAYEAP